MNLVAITTLDDPRVDVFRDVRDRDLRGRDRIFMAESEMVLRRLLRTPERIHSVFVSPGKLDRLRDGLERLPADVSVFVGDVDLMSDIAGFHIHRGVLAAGHRLHPSFLAMEGAFAPLRDRTRLAILVAEGMTNVDNMGALFRNAAAFGIDGILLDPACCDPLYRKAIRVSMGHVLSIPYAVSRDWPADLDRLRDEWGLTIVGAELTKDAVPLREMPRDERIAIVLGAEATGLSREVLDRCDVVTAIPMAPGVPSLNVAVASGVVLYELRRGRV